MITGIAVSLVEFRNALRNTRYFSFRILSLWKIIVFMCCILLYMQVQEDDPATFFSHFNYAFADRNYTVHEVSTNIHRTMLAFTKYNK